MSLPFEKSSIYTTYLTFREEAARKRVKTLQKQLQEVRRDKEIQIQVRNLDINYL